MHSSCQTPKLLSLSPGQNISTFASTLLNFEKYWQQVNFNIWVILINKWCKRAVNYCYWHAISLLTKYWSTCTYNSHIRLRSCSNTCHISFSCRQSVCSNKQTKRHSSAALWCCYGVLFKYTKPIFKQKLSHGRLAKYLPLLLRRAKQCQL